MMALSIALVATPSQLQAQQLDNTDDIARTGSITFPTSGDGAAQAEFVTGVLALHSFWYEEARDRFVNAQQIDPGFAMAWWGEAMTYDNALLTSQQSDNEQRGQEVVERMNQRDADGLLNADERERAYMDAIRLRFESGAPLEFRRENYAAAMEQIAADYPDDDEAAVFASLALMALPVFDRQQATHVVAVASRLEEIYERNREHPGVLHYLIHVYDTPTFALMGLRQARHYADVAPASSHALHMPSHIFRHLGMWPEVAESNRAAYQASVEWQQRTQRSLISRDFHALDWLLDAYIRLGQLNDADAIMAELNEIESKIAGEAEASARFAEIVRALRAHYSLAQSGTTNLPNRGH
jgi:hypothetical protein